MAPRLIIEPMMISLMQHARCVALKMNTFKSRKTFLTLIPTCERLWRVLVCSCLSHERKFNWPKTHVHNHAHVHAHNHRKGAPGVSALSHAVQSRFLAVHWPLVSSAQLTTSTPTSATLTTSKGGGDKEEVMEQTQTLWAAMIKIKQKLDSCKRCNSIGKTLMHFKKHKWCKLCTHLVTIYLQYFIMIFTLTSDVVLLFQDFCFGNTLSQ